MRTYVGVLFFIGASVCLGTTTKEIIDVINNNDLSHRYIRRHNLNLRDLEAIDAHGQTPLIAAIKNKKDHAVRILLQEGVNATVPVADFTPLELAVKYSTVPIIQQLINHGVPLTVRACELAGMRMPIARYFYNYLKTAITNYRNARVFVGMSRKDAYTCLGALMLHIDDPSFVRLLLLLGSRADYKDCAGNIALNYTSSMSEKARIIAHEYETVYDQLLMHVQQKTLSKQFLQKYFKGLNRLSINRAYAQLDWRTVLMDAVKHDYYDGALLLLNYGAAGLQEALVLALRFSSKSMIQLLIRKGACLWTIDEPLQLVVRENPAAKTIVDWLAPLVSHGSRNKALLVACMKGDVAVVDMLLRHGASIYYRDKHGVTPLYAAVLGHNFELIKNLAAHKHVKLTDDQLAFTRTYFPQAYEFLLHRKL